MSKKNPLADLLKNDSNVRDNIYENTVMFAFTARSGSTAITDAIASMGLARRVDEIFNPRGPMQSLYNKCGGNDIVEYINNIHKKTMLTDTMIFKTNYRDLSCVVKRYDIHTLFPNLKVVYIERKDKTMQAVSAYKAICTNQWHQRANTKETKLPNGCSLDINKIVTFKKRFEDDCNNWGHFFELNKIRPHDLYYEEFDGNHEQVLREIFRYITGRHYIGDIKLNYKKLRDEISEEWASKVNKYLADIR